MQQGKGITYRKLGGFSAQGLRIWALVFLLLGAVGYGIFALKLIPPYGVDADGISLAPMSMYTAGVALQVLQMCALPLFCFLLVQGVQHTISLKNYAIRIGLLALVTELPYNLCMTGKLFGAISFQGGFRFDMSQFSLNPVFGTLLCLVLLFFFRHYAGTTFKLIATKVVIWLFAFLWVEMLHIEYGALMLLLVPVLWMCRKKKGTQVFCGSAAMFLCCIFYVGGMSSELVGCFIAPLTFLLVHFYNEEPGEPNKYINYLAYPVILLTIGLLAKFAL